MRLGVGPRLALTLTVAGLLSGVIIVGVYELTRPRILANQAARLQAAVFEVLPGIDSMEGRAWRGGELVRLDGEAAAGAEAVYAGYRGETLVGWAIAGEGAGFQDTIRLLYGFDPDRQRVVGMRVLESRETPGLGDRIIKDEEFVGAFADLDPGPGLTVVKDGATQAWEVDAITGATISTQAVVKIVNERHAVWARRLRGGGDDGER